MYRAPLRERVGEGRCDLSSESPNTILATATHGRVIAAQTSKLFLDSKSWIGCTSVSYTLLYSATLSPVRGMKEKGGSTLS